MRKKKGLWIGFLILFVGAAVIAYSGMTSPLRAQTQPETLEAPPAGSAPPAQIGPSGSPQLPPGPERASDPKSPIRRTAPRPQASAPAPTTPAPASPPASVPGSIPPPPIPPPAAAATTLSPVPPLPAPSATPSPPPGVTAPVIAPSPPPAVPKGSGFVFNFDNADLYEVIRVMAGIMKINYLIDPKVRGTVNIHTAGQLTAGDVFPIFQSILKLNGATAIKKENLIEIVPMTDAKKLYTLPSLTREPGKGLPEEKFTIQIIQLKYIPVTEVSKMVRPFLSDGADIIEHPPNNIIIIGDVASNVRKCLDIIDLFDMDIFVDLRVRIYPISNADVTEVSKEMERIFASFEVSTKSGRGIGITFTPVARINSLLVVSSIPNIFDKVEGWLKELDKIPTEATKSSVFVYYCQNAKAKDLADVLKGVFTGGKDKKEEFKTKVTEPTQRGIRPAPTPAAPTVPAKEEAGAVPEGEINIVVDETNNALVIRAYQRDYRTILETIKKLDIYPKQVLIEVLLADVSLTGASQFGLEWARFLSSNRPNAQSIVISGQPPATRDATDSTSATGPFDAPLAGGIRYAIVDMGQRVFAAVRAAASEGRAKVIISPHILASNGKEAKIQIGSTQPVPTGSYVAAGTSVTSNIVDVPIEYKDIGTMVGVTPRVSDGGLVTLEINIEDSAPGPSVAIGTQVTTVTSSSTNTYPSFKKLTLKTVLSIIEGQSIAIGGLIRENKSETISGVPVLSKIPIIGPLFGSRIKDQGRTELVLILTPHVITDQEQSKSVTEEFKEKMRSLKEEMEKMQKK